MQPALELKRMNEILALRTPSGRVVGFHASNLEVAQLSEQAWKSFQEAPVSEVLDWDKEKNPRVRSATKAQGARSITINVTQVCNLHCTYCAAGGDGSYGDPVKKIAVEKTLPQLKYLIEKVPAGEEFHITFLGGEPLLYPDAIDILADFAMELGQDKGLKISFTVVTNGTLFTDKNIEILKSIRPDITISIDGPAEINDRVRPTKGNKGTTSLVVEGVRRLLQHKDSLGKIGMSGVFGHENMELEKAYEFYSSFDVDWFDFTYDHKEIRAEVSREFTQHLMNIAKAAYEKGGEKALRKIKLFDTYFQILDSQQRVENYCGAGKSFFMIDARNNIYTCPWVVGESQEIVGHGDSLWEDKLTAYQDPLYEKNGCQSCWARFMCGGGCMYIHRNKTGDKHKVDENFCERTRSLIATALMYYELSRSPITASSSERLIYEKATNTGGSSEN